MNYYLVWVRSVRYRGDEALTYASAEKLRPGALVLVPLQRQLVMGIVVKDTPKPKFATKPITRALPLPPIPENLLELGAWLQRFYASPLGTVVQLLVPSAFSEPSLAVRPVEPNAFSAVALPALTPEQQEALTIMGQPGTYLLHGKTGSGKTRLYLELALQTLRIGKSAILLTPEIGLTSQLAQTFQETFGSQVIILHSQLTVAERQRAWLQVLRASAPVIIIGPRSALFSPVKNLGLIVVDESHDGAYKQQQAPYYHATRVASRLAQLTDSILVLGSATPSITDYYMAEQKARPIIRLTKLARGEHPTPTEFTIVDLKDRTLFPRTPHISTPLTLAVHAALERGEQSLIYLNRRGTARMIMCDHCGWQALCPHCNLPLVYHGDNHSFRCHTCGYQQQPILTCPACGHASITFTSVGTKAIVDELAKVFPHARIQRFDTDNKKAERFEQHYESIRSGQVDILVGTQLLTKGLDLPRLSTVGVVIADTSLAVPDFSAKERTYQLLTQVLGRVGRGHVGATAIIQTYRPDEPLIKDAINDAWSNFYHKELLERQKFRFPPFYHILKLSCIRATPSSAERAAEKLKDRLAQNISDLIIDGPAPALHEKVRNKYQWQLVVKATNRSRLLAAVKLIPSGNWSYDLDPIDLM